MKIENLSNAAETHTHAESLIVSADGSTGNGKVQIVLEHRIEVFINGQAVLKIVCTPTNLTEMIIGRLITEGYVETSDEIESVNINESGTAAHALIKESPLLCASCGEESTSCTDNKVLMSRNDRKTPSRLAPAEYTPADIFSLCNEFASGSSIHKKTQGTHSCYLGYEGKTVFSAEDIGRHNALDKAVGYAEMNGLKRNKCILYTTGRVPADMIRKAVNAGIPVLVSKAVPTDEAIKIAKEYNIELICRAWPDRYEIFNKAEAL